MSSRALTLSVVLMACVGGTAAGCADVNETKAARPPRHGAPSEAHDASTIAVAWGPSTTGIRLPRTGARFVSPKRLAFVSSGSGSCPSLPTRLTVVARDMIRMQLALCDPGGRPCTADLRSTVVEVAIDPARVTVRRPLTIDLVYVHGRRHVTLIAPPLD